MIQPKKIYRLLTFISANALAFSLVSSCTRYVVGDGSPCLKSINIVDRNGFSETVSVPERLEQYERVNFLAPQPYQKVLRVYSRNQLGENYAEITSYHPNGQIKQYLEVVNNRASGSYKEWYVNGSLKLQATIVGGDPDINTASEKTWLFDGCSKAWDEEGRLLAEIPYVKGELNGLSIYYHPSGALWKKVPFERNQTHGVSETYLVTGETLQTTEYSRGVKNGRSLRFWHSQGTASDEEYVNGLLLKGLYYDICGNLIATIENGNGFRATFGKDSINELQEYRNGLMVGELKVYDTEGRLIKIYHVKNDLKHGEEDIFNPQPNAKGELYPRLLINWYEGKIQGTVKTWYDNGVLESQREMSNNTKNGVSTAWYSDGSLMLIEEYDRDKIVKGEYFKCNEKIPVSQIKAGNGVATLFDADGNFLRKVEYYNGRPQE